MRNNLFYYATSELSQDAFICWLTSFALEGSKDPLLQKCAKQLIALFVPELASLDFSVTNVERQVGHIDVLLTVSSGEIIYKIIIEDKTFTSEHDNQLKRYLELVEQTYPGCIAKGVYYKTGFQCNLSSVKEAGYAIISREQMLRFMTPYTTCVTNQIFLDYYEYWHAFQEETEKYRTLPVNEWKWAQTNGFYDYLRTSDFFASKGLWMGYDYVANRAGGFYGLWIGAKDYCINIAGAPFEIYLQMETSTDTPSYAQLCLKLCAHKKNTDSNVLRQARDLVVYETDWGYKLTQFNFHKPKRLSIGRHMTIGIYNAALTDYISIMKAFESAIQDYQKLLDALK